MGSVVVTPGFKSVGSVVACMGLVALGMWNILRAEIETESPTLADSYLLHHQGSSLIF